MTGEGHFDQRREHAAIGAVVIGEHQILRAQLVQRGGESREQLRVVEIGRLAPSSPNTCARAEPPRRFAPAPRSTSSSTVAPRSVRSCGVQVLRTSRTGANAEMINDTGATTDLRAGPSPHAVFIDSESLPTGIAMPSAGQSSSPTACTVAYSAASSPGSPQAAIQLAESFTFDSAPMSAARMLVSASPTARRPEAGASSTATRRAFAHRHRFTGVPEVIGDRHRDVGDRHLPRAHHLVAADHAADRAIADRDQEGLVGDGREAQQAIGRVAQIELSAANGSLRRRTRRTSRSIFGALPNNTSSGRSTGACRVACLPAPARRCRRFRRSPRTGQRSRCAMALKSSSLAASMTST